MSPTSNLTQIRPGNPLIDLISVVKIGLGLMGLLAPAITASLFGFSTTLTGESFSHTSASEMSLAIRWFAVRELANGLLLRDEMTRVLFRGLQMSLLIDVVDSITITYGYYTQSISQSPFLAMIAGPMVLLELYLLRQ